MLGNRIRHVHEELRYVGQPVDEGSLLLSLDGEAPDPLPETLGDVQIAVPADREAGGSLEVLGMISACCNDSRSMTSVECPVRMPGSEKASFMEDSERLDWQPASTRQARLQLTR